jgi:Ca2+-binding EF-hand superfamily protein
MSFDEFEALMKNSRMEVSDSEIKQYWSLLDSNNDGLLSKEELSKHVEIFGSFQMTSISK